MSTVEEICAAIEAAPPADRVRLAEALLRKYDGDDKELVAPDIMSMAFLSSQFDDKGERTFLDNPEV